MLANFFRLNGEPKDCCTLEEFIILLSNSTGLRDIVFRPPSLSLEGPGVPSGLFDKQTFSNVSFSWTTISGVVFRDCAFTDCLFNGTRFVDCEFHGCTFEGCNPNKVTFDNTYINPSVFERMLDPVEHWNIGVHLFQQLYKNSMNMHQREFSNSAEFNLQKWNRYVLNNRYSKKVNPDGKNKDIRYFTEWLVNYSFYIFAGYGIRTKFLVVWAFVVVAGSVGANFCWWDSLGVVGKNGSAVERRFIDVLYYTLTIPAGIGDLIPASDWGKLVFTIEVLLGLIVVSLFATWLVKRAIR